MKLPLPLGAIRTDEAYGEVADKWIENMLGRISDPLDRSFDHAVHLWTSC